MQTTATAITRTELDAIIERCRTTKASRETKRTLADNNADWAWEWEQKAKHAATMDEFFDCKNCAAICWAKAAGFTPKNHTAHMEYADAAENTRAEVEHLISMYASKKPAELC
jgi:hypothetical protein